MALNMTSISALLLTLTVCIHSVSMNDVSGSENTNARRSDDASMSAWEVLVQQLDARVQQQDARIQQLESVIQTLQSNMGTQEDVIRIVQNNLSVPSVAFTVKFSSDLDGVWIPVRPHQPLAFDSIITNLGDGYNSQTGIFTAPFAGTYVFFLSVMAIIRTGDVQIAIDKHGTVLGAVYAVARYNDNDQGSSLVTTHLAKGEQVWVRQDGVGTTVRGSHYTVFSGYLAKAD